MSSVRTVVLLSNLGTPAEPTAPAIRTFLREFLSDPRVVSLSRFVWLPILYAFVLPFRPGRLVHAYESIWLKSTAKDGVTLASPLSRYSHNLAEKLHALTVKENEEVLVAVTMRYGVKNVAAVLDDLHRRHPSITNVIVLPLFPQYSSSTTASVFDAVFKYYGRSSLRYVPSLFMIRDYADNCAYVQAIGKEILASVEDHFGGQSRTPAEWRTILAPHVQDTVIILSYHSIPVQYVEEGDDYPVRCRRTTDGVAKFLEEKLGIPLEDVVLQIYQSRFGNLPWLEPFLVDAMELLPQAADNEVVKKRKLVFAEKLGKPHFATRTAKTCFVATPGFAADCLETLHEVKEEAAEIFEKHGGTVFKYVPCLNDSDDHVKALFSAIKQYIHN